MARFTGMMTLIVGMSLAWMGCSAGDGSGEWDELDPSSEEASRETGEAERIGTLEAALDQPSKAPRSHCSGLLCTCSGDEDCNDMFSSGECGDLSGCDTSDPEQPQCWCFSFKVNRRTLGVALPSASTLAASP